MLRRSFRIGLWLGLLAGIGLALVKRLQGRPEPQPTPQPMPEPIPADPEPAPQPIPDPVPLDTDRHVELEPLVAVVEEDTTVPPSGDVLPPSPVSPVAAPLPLPPQPEPEPEPPPAPAPVPPPATAPVHKAAKRPIKAARPKPTPAAAPAQKRAPRKKAVPPWVDAKAGACPASHPVKAKLSSQIFHLPGMLNYQRAAADRCYVSAEAAEADGLRRAKR